MKYFSNWPTLMTATLNYDGHCLISPGEIGYRGSCGNENGIITFLAIREWPFLPRLRTLPFRSPPHFLYFTAEIKWIVILLLKGTLFRLWSSGCRSRYQGLAGRFRFIRSPFCIIGESGWVETKVLNWMWSVSGQDFKLVEMETFWGGLYTNDETAIKPR